MMAHRYRIADELAPVAALLAAQLALDLFEVPDEVKLELTTRCYSEEVRKTIIEGVKRTARGVAIA